MRMSSPSKNKGSEYERNTVALLVAHGWVNAERTRAGWQDDRGDIDGVPGVTFECKNQQKMELAQWVDELRVEMVHGRNEVGAVIHKRRGIADVGAHYATMPVSVFLDLLKRAGY